MAPVKNVRIHGLYMFPSNDYGKRLDTADNHSFLWLTSENLREKFLELKKELKEALGECSYYPCYSEDHVCRYFGLEERPFYWAFEEHLIGGGAL